MPGGLMDGLGPQSYGKQQPANQFPELTPEQIAMLQRGMTTETLSPLDLAMGGGAGAALGRGGVAIGRAIEGNLPRWAELLTYLGSGAAGVNMAANMPRIRAQQNTLRDAEGQPGYGDHYMPGRR